MNFNFFGPYTKEEIAEMGVLAYCEDCLTILPPDNHFVEMTWCHADMDLINSEGNYIYGCGERSVMCFPCMQRRIGARDKWMVFVCKEHENDPAYFSCESCRTWSNNPRDRECCRRCQEGNERCQEAYLLEDQIRRMKLFWGTWCGVTWEEAEAEKERRLEEWLGPASERQIIRW